MKTTGLLSASLWLSTLVSVRCGAPLPVATPADAAGPDHSAIPLANIGSKATLGYHGDALAVAATAGGALLRCGFQKLEGRVTAGGLRLESTANSGGKLHLVARSVSREDLEGEGAWLSGWPVERHRSGVSAERRHSPETQFAALCRDAATGPGFNQPLPSTGAVGVADQLVRFIRPGLTEEYSVSVDGVRQDFVLTERPEGESELRVELALSGARVEATAYGVKLKLDGSGRELAYSRLRATDATGRELPARLEVLAPDRLAVRVADANATYPVRIDPTFSDANWMALGSGMNSVVWALVVSSGDLYAGGRFTTAGGIAATNIAKWDGSSWSALGPGLSGGRGVYALAVSGTNLYAGGTFAAVGDIAVNYIAKWDGSAWSALGSGMGGFGGSYRGVVALAVSGSNLYAAGPFTTAGGIAASSIAKWDGSSWSAVGSGIDFLPYALAASGNDVYAGGFFLGAGGAMLGHIAKWDGSSWTYLGSGMGGPVHALAVSGPNLYAGGSFDRAGGTAANWIAKWDGSSWSALGSGMNYDVLALAVSATDLFVGGAFTTAGGKVSPYIAQANLIPQRGVIQNIGVNGGAVALDCLGLPGTAYAVEHATDVLFTADLTTLLTTNAPAPDGLFRCTDSSPPSATAFYRLRRH